jgi:hypothetical protein
MVGSKVIPLDNMVAVVLGRITSKLFLLMVYDRNIDELTYCNGSTCLYDAIHESYEQVK